MTGELGTYILGDPALKTGRVAVRSGWSVNDGIVDLEHHRVSRLNSSRPLARLQAMQRRLLKQRNLSSPTRGPELIAGVDISYVSPRRGVAAYVLFDVRQREVVWSTMLCRKVRFPYVSGYLSFRELPLLLGLLERVRKANRMGDVVLG